MERSLPDQLAMYVAVKAVCDAKPAVWRRSEAFREAYADFCQCLINLGHLQPGMGIFQSVAHGVAIEMSVADTILTTEMDELIELFEQVDVAFVDDYTTARTLENAADIFTPSAATPAAGSHN